jgi:transglutaminase/protease-like cytokinesis protein 3
LYSGAAERFFYILLIKMKNNNFILLQSRVRVFGFILFLFVCFLPVFSAENHDFKNIDKAVIGMKHARSVKKVIRFIARHSENDWDRARGAYVWIANNIEYDVDTYLSESKVMKDAEEVFASGKAICQGYAELYSDIVTGLGLQTVIISGYAKGYGYKAGFHFEKTDHSWNAVKIENKWHFIETTWGAGGFDGEKYIRDYTTAWFDTDPRLFVLHHFPEDTSWLLTTSLTLADYEKMPHIETCYIKDFNEAGFSAEEQLTLFTYIPFPKGFSYNAMAFRKMG